MRVLFCFVLCSFGLLPPVALAQSDTFVALQNLTEFGVELSSFETNASLNDLKWRLAPAFFLRNPDYPEYLRAEIGFDNKLEGFIAGTGLFGTLGYQFLFPNSNLLLEIRGGLFPIDVEALELAYMALGVQVFAATQDTVSFEGFSFDLDSDTTISAFSLANQKDFFAAGSTRVGFDLLERDAFGFGVKGVYSDLFASVLPSFMETVNTLFVDASYFYPLADNLGVVGMRALAGHHPLLMGNAVAQADLSAVLFGSYRYSLPLEFVFYEDFEAVLKRVSFSPRMGAYLDEAFAVGADLALSFDLHVFNEALSFFGLLGFESREGLYFSAGLGLGY